MQLPNHAAIPYACTTLCLAFLCNSNVSVLWLPTSLGCARPRNASSDHSRALLLPVLSFSYLPLAIVGASAFYDTLSNFTSVLAYWSALYAAVILVDHIFIRRTSFESYDISAWNDWHRLPWGVAAVGSAALSLGLLVPSISQIWFTGPIAKHSGDLGFELGFAACALLYFPCRLLERRLTGR